MSSAERLALVEHADPVLSVVAQCRLLRVPVDREHWFRLIVNIRSS
jgi:hypothetical protein